MPVRGSLRNREGQRGLGSGSCRTMANGATAVLGFSGFLVHASFVAAEPAPSARTPIEEIIVTAERQELGTIPIRPKRHLRRRRPARYAIDGLGPNRRNAAEAARSHACGSLAQLGRGYRPTDQPVGLQSRCHPRHSGRRPHQLPAERRTADRKLHRLAARGQGTDRGLEGRVCALLRVRYALGNCQSGHPPAPGETAAQRFVFR